MFDVSICSPFFVSTKVARGARIVKQNSSEYYIYSLDKMLQHFLMQLYYWYGVYLRLPLMLHVRSLYNYTTCHMIAQQQYNIFLFTFVLNLSPRYVFHKAFMFVCCHVLSNNDNVNCSQRGVIIIIK